MTQGNIAIFSIDIASSTEYPQTVNETNVFVVLRFLFYVGVTPLKESRGIPCGTAMPRCWIAQERHLGKVQALLDTLPLK